MSTTDREVDLHTRHDERTLALALLVELAQKAALVPHLARDADRALEIARKAGVGNG